VFPHHNATGKAEKMSPKDWIMVGLTVVFVLLYVLAFAGILQPPNNDKLVGQVAPIISVIIGYYFGRLPGEKNEENLQQHANDAKQQRQEAVEARNQAEAGRSQAEIQRERFATKVGDAKAALAAAAPGVPVQDLAPTLGGAGGQAPNEDAVRQAAVTALKILEAA
jgi:hypothetical protein